MNPIIDKMLELTADIAEELLQMKDDGQNKLSAELKLKIISLAELAASPDPVEADEPQANDDAQSVVALPASPEQTPEQLPEDAEEVVEEEESEAIEASAEAEAAALAEVEPEPAKTVEEKVEQAVLTKTEVAEAESAEAEEQADANPCRSRQVESCSDRRNPVENHPVQSQSVQSRPAESIDIKELQRAFSINDAFLFRREIFGGAKARFDSALQQIALLQDHYQLQHFLVEQLNLNLNESPGKEFYQILRGFFK